MRHVTREVSRWWDPPPGADEGVREAWVHNGQDEFVDDVKDRALGLWAHEGVAMLKPGGSAQTPGALVTVWGEGELWYTLWQAEEKHTRPRIPTVEAAIAFMELLAALLHSYMVVDKSHKALDARDRHMAGPAKQLGLLLECPLLEVIPRLLLSPWQNVVVLQLV